MRQQIQATRRQPAETTTNNAQSDESHIPIPRTSGRTRELLRDTALNNAIRKRSAGVPTYTVAETAALLSISQEYLYRLIQAGGFPAVRMRIGGSQGRYVVPAKAVDQMLDQASAGGDCVEIADLSDAWRANTTGGAA